MAKSPPPPSTLAVVSRRTLLCRAPAALTFLGALGQNGIAFADDEIRRSPAFELAYRTLIGEAEPADDGSVILELPEVPENGNTVPFRIEVKSPMTVEDSVKTIHLLSTANPQPRVAAFHLSALSGRASVAGRMRLAKTQDVVALAERSDGKFLVSIKRVDVTIGGCGN